MNRDFFDLALSVTLMIIGLAILLMFSWACGAPKHINTSGSIGVSDHIEEQEGRAVYISVTCVDKDGKRKGYSGSGVVLTPMLIATAQHVVDACTDEGHKHERISITTADGNHMAAEVYMRTNADIAIIKPESPIGKLGPVPLALPPEAGATVCSMTAAPERGRECGEMIATLGSRPRANVFHRAKTVMGNSGSGLYDLQGRLVGIVVAMNTCAGKPCGVASAIWPIQGGLKGIWNDQSKEHDPRGGNRD